MSEADRVRAYEQRMEELQAELDLLSSHAMETTCGGADESQEVELYDGTLEVTRAFVDRYEKPTGQLKWIDALAERFPSPDSPGNVAGQRWGSCGLIGKDLLLTAGHCFDGAAGAWGFPQRQGQKIAPSEIATLMEVTFNYQIDGTAPGRVARDGEQFPVVGLLEHRPGGLDFAVARLGRNASGLLPGEKYGWYELADDDPTMGEMLCLMQHPNGQPKRVETGPVRDNVGGRITYDSLDTTGGSSGALLLHYPSGRVVGVHTNGGCTRIAGFNYGVSLGLIRHASSVLPSVSEPVVTPTPAPVPTPTPTPVVTPTPTPTPVVTPTPTPVPTSMTTADRLARFDRVFAAIADALSSVD